jgi:hypothetical protein
MAATMASKIWTWTIFAAFITLADKTGSEAPANRTAYEVEFAVSQYNNISEDQGTLCLHLKTNSTKTYGQKNETKCALSTETYEVSSNKRHYNITLLVDKFKKHKRCQNITLMLNISKTDDIMYEKSETFHVTLALNKKKKSILIGPNNTTLIMIQDNDVIEVQFKTNYTAILEDTGHIQITLIFNTTIQQGVTPVEISVVCTNANRDEDFNFTEQGTVLMSSIICT